MRRFKSSYSKPMLLATCFLLIILSFAIYIIINQMAKFPIDSFNFIGVGIALCFILATLLYSFLSQIRYVCLTKENLIIKKMLGKVIIPRCNILQVQHKKSLMFDVRLWGISGLFGHIGVFWNKSIGKYTAFVKDGSSMLEIKTEGKCYVVSCDDYVQMIKLLND